MRCRYCGAAIPDGALRCRACGEEVRIVPDYNPLDDVLTAQVKGSIDGTETPLDAYEYQTDRMRRNASKSNRQRSSAPRRTSGSSRRQVSELTPEERRRRAKRKKALQKKKRLKRRIVLGILAFVVLVLALVMYQFSYGSRVKKGYKALQNKEYSEAERYFKKAVKRNPKKGAAYEGLTEVYIAQDKKDKAEKMLLDAVNQYSDSAEVYESAFKFYVITKKEGEIPLLLDGAKKSVAAKLTDYEAATPKFSLSEQDDAFDDVQQLSLESDEKTIYYTTDGSDPVYSDTREKYEKPIQISEGETVVKAISLNSNKIPSLTVTKTYTVELPIEDAPAISPSTGQYSSATKIEISVPEGYTAYYTMDGSEPTEDSEEYTEPVDMPEGTTIFKAVLVNGKGRLSGITTRNYELTSGDNSDQSTGRISSGTLEDDDDSDD